MKKITFIVLLMTLSYFAVAQQGAIIKSYAYRQETIPGQIMEGQEDARFVSHFIYLEILKKNNIVIKYIWIGNHCSIPSVIAISKLPVVMVHNTGMGMNEGSTQLVPKTKNTILQVMQGKEIADQKLTTGKRLAAKNEFVIAYRYKGKWCYYTGKSIKTLETQFGI